MCLPHSAQKPGKKGRRLVWTSKKILLMPVKPKRDWSPSWLKHTWSGLVRAGFATAFSWVGRHQKSPSIPSYPQNKGVCLLGHFTPGNPRAKHPIKLLFPPSLEPCPHPTLALPILSPSFALNLLPYKYLLRWGMLNASHRESNKATGGLSFAQAPSSLPVGWFRLLEAARLFQNKASAGRNEQRLVARLGWAPVCTS